MADRLLLKSSASTNSYVVVTAVVLTIAVVALVAVIVIWPRERVGETFTGTVANVKSSRVFLCVSPDSDPAVPRCGVPYAELDSKIDSGVPVTVRVLLGQDDSRGEVFILTPR